MCDTTSYRTGDGDGQNEMNWSMNYLKKYLNAFPEDASAIRVFFPDNIVSNLRQIYQVIASQLECSEILAL